MPETPKIAKQANAEGGNEVEKLNVGKEADVVAEDVTVEAPAEDAATDAAVEETEVVADEAAVEVSTEDAVAQDPSAETLEKAAEVSEDKVDEPDFAKMLGDLKGFFSETLGKASEANASQVTAIKETVETFSKSVDARISELAEQHTALSSAVNDIKSTIDSVQKRVDAVESETAIKKSSDLGRSEEVTIKKSKWNGSFLGSVNEIFN